MKKSLMRLWLEEIDTPDLDAEGKLQVAEARKELDQLESDAEIGRAAVKAIDYFGYLEAAVLEGDDVEDIESEAWESVEELLQWAKEDTRGQD